MATLVQAEVTPSGFTLIPPESEKHGEYISGSPQAATRQGRWLLVAKHPPRPSRFLFGAAIDPRLRIKRPISLRISKEGASTVAHWEDIDEFGYGVNLSSALDDLGRTLGELFFSLNESGRQLSQHLQKVRERLNEFVELRSS